MEIRTDIPFQKKVRKGTITEKLKSMQPGDCLVGVNSGKANSIHAMAKKHGIKLRRAEQGNGETWFWRV